MLWPEGVDFGDAGSVTPWCGKLDAAGARFRAAGITLGYHHHGHRIRPIPGSAGSGVCLRHTARRTWSPELDTYWCRPAEAIALMVPQNAGPACPFLHLQGLRDGTEIGSHSSRKSPRHASFARINRRMPSAPAPVVIVEQDTCPHDPFDSLRISLGLPQVQPRFLISPWPRRPPSRTFRTHPAGLAPIGNAFG